jgi:hypothetical protein
VLAWLRHQPEPVPAAAVARALLADVGAVERALRGLAQAGLVGLHPGLDGPRWAVSGRGPADPAPGAGPSADLPPPAPEGPHLRRALAEAEAEIARLRADREALRQQVDALQRALAARSPPPPPGALAAHLTDLITLCHPDRHDNSERATRVTRWLLEERARHPPRRG